LQLINIIIITRSSKTVIAASGFT